LRAAIAMLCVIFFRISCIIKHRMQASTYKRAGIGYDSRSSLLFSLLFGYTDCPIICACNVL
jgi:hypothetical protein